MHTVVYCDFWGSYCWQGLHHFVQKCPSQKELGFLKDNCFAETKRAEWLCIFIQENFIPTHTTVLQTTSSLISRPSDTHLLKSREKEGPGTWKFWKIRLQRSAPFCINYNNCSVAIAALSQWVNQVMTDFSPGGLSGGRQWKHPSLFTKSITIVILFNTYPPVIAASIDFSDQVGNIEYQQLAWPQHML